jgi:DHA1 family bicyclomycin/chloramphenicol resistance-like MFS transporter
VTESRLRQWAILLVLGITAALSPVAVDLLGPSLPNLSEDIGITAQRTELTIYVFMIGYGLAPALWGRLSDSLGRRPVMFAGMFIFCISSLACVVTDDPFWLIGLRGIQGVGAAAGATMARAIVRDIYGAAGATRGMAGMFSMMALVPFLVPPLGGVIASQFGWEACFAAMALIGFTGAVAYYFLIPETLPVAVGKVLPADNSILRVLENRAFLQHVLCNMFCVATMVLFAANFSFILVRDYHFDSTLNGLALALFNGSIAAGTYLVWPLMPRFGAHRSILIGSSMCSLGWLTIAALATGDQPGLMLLVGPLVVASMGCGIIMSLCSGGALTPFSHNSGTASSIYLLLQSAGATAISFGAGMLLPKQLLPVALMMAGCGLLALASKLLIGGGLHSQSA